MKSKLLCGNNIPVMKNVIKKLEVLYKGILNLIPDKSNSICSISIIDLVVIWNLNPVTAELIALNCSYQLLLNKVNKRTTEKYQNPNDLIYGPWTGDIYPKILNSFQSNYNELLDETKKNTYFLSLYLWLDGFDIFEKKNETMEAVILTPSEWPFYIRNSQVIQSLVS